MDFFGAQDGARRKTLWLGLLFGSAVVSLVVLTDVLIAVVLLYSQQDPQFDAPATLPTSQWVLISLAVVAVIGGASWYKLLALRSGGRAVAERLGGDRIDPNTLDLHGRRLLNVVEEMAIASGIPVPPVYLIDDDGMNAFAAGFTPDDAVIGVTRGLSRHLSRGELQGVIAHEYSHILNGDMAINLRLVAVLHGILFLGLAGRILLQTTGRSRRRSKGGGGAALIGGGLMLIGFGGSFFGNLIKAAISRQREFLADASAVQFTRDSGGIAGALKKIGAAGATPKLSSGAASEVSHMFFADALSRFAGGLAATHPPLETRIRALEPSWDGAFPERVVEVPVLADEAASGFAGGPSHPSPTAAHMLERVGRPDLESLTRAHELIGTAEPACAEAARDPWSARALVYALLLSPDAQLRNPQLEHLDEHADKGMSQEVRRLAARVRANDADHALTLVSMMMPALKQLSQPQYSRFAGNVVALIRMDGEIELREWVLHRLLFKTLSGQFRRARAQRVRHRSLSRVADSAAEVLSALARHAGGDASFTAACTASGLELAYQSHADPGYARLDAALRVLLALAPSAKRDLVQAATACVLTPAPTAEGCALLRAIAATLDCPMPPLAVTPSEKE